MVSSSIEFKKCLIFLTVLFVQAGWAEDQAPTTDVFNELREAFKSSDSGAAINVSDIVGDWSCEFKFKEKDMDNPSVVRFLSEPYSLSLKSKLPKKKDSRAEKSDDGLSLEAEVVRYTDKKHSKIEIRMGTRRVVSGQASWPALHEMAHDEDLDTVDEIRISHNGSIRTLMIERSYYYKGPFRSFSRDGGSETASLLVPRAYSVCAPAL